MEYLLNSTTRELVFFILGFVSGMTCAYYIIKKFYIKPIISKEEILCTKLMLIEDHKALVTLYDGKRKSINCPHYRQKNKTCLQMGVKEINGKMIPSPIYRPCHIMD